MPIASDPAVPCDVGRRSSCGYSRWLLFMSLAVRPRRHAQAQLEGTGDIASRLESGSWSPWAPARTGLLGTLTSRLIGSMRAALCRGAGAGSTAAQGRRRGEHGKIAGQKLRPPPSVHCPHFSCFSPTLSNRPLGEEMTPALTDRGSLASALGQGADPRGSQLNGSSRPTADTGAWPASVRNRVDS